MNNARLYSLVFIQFLMLISGNGYVFSQKKERNTDAEKAFLNKKFSTALEYFRIATDKNPDLVYKRAICYYNLNRFDSSLTDFQKYLGFKKHDDEAIFYTARSLHQLENYKKAVELYRLFLKVSNSKSKLRSEAKLLLMHAANAGKTLIINEFALLLPPGKSGNSETDDYAPIENPRNPGQLYFCSNRRGRFELFFEKFSERESNAAVLLDARYNAVQNQQIVAFPDNGYQILYLADGTIKLDNFKDGFEQSLAVPLKGLEKIKLSDAQLLNDSILIFSADLPGGYGALDIYAALKNEQGHWSKIKNLGPRVNTVFDERAAFLCDNSTVLYFSSNRPESIGGFDVFKLDFQKNSDAIPFSFPVNSPGDELFFKPDQTMQEVWISAVRKNGFGGLDNYSLRFREPLSKSNGVNLSEYLFEEQSVQISEKTEPKAETDTFYFSDVNFYSDGNLEPVSEKILNETADFLQKNPTVKLLITAHTDNTQSMELSLLFTLSQCEKVASMLLKKGIAADRIYLRGLGGQYPAAKNRKFDNSPDQTAMMINRRIELNFISNENIKIRITKKEKMISTVLKENGAEKYLEELSGLSFKIDLAGRENQQNFDFLISMNDVSLEKKASAQKFSFSLGMSKKFDAIAILLETAISSGFDKATIQAYWDGFPMDAALVEKMSQKETELQKYKEYLQNKGGK